MKLQTETTFPRKMSHSPMTGGELILYLQLGRNLTQSTFNYSTGLIHTGLQLNLQSEEVFLVPLYKSFTAVFVRYNLSFKSENIKEAQKYYKISSILPNSTS